MTHQTQSNPNHRSNHNNNNNNNNNNSQQTTSSTHHHHHHHQRLLNPLKPPPIISKHKLIKPIMIKSYSEPITTTLNSHSLNASQPICTPNRNGKRDRSALIFPTSNLPIHANHLNLSTSKPSTSFNHPFLQSPSSLSNPSNSFTFSFTPQPSPSSSSHHHQSLMMMRSCNTNTNTNPNPTIKSKKIDYFPTTVNQTDHHPIGGFWSDFKKTLEQYDQSDFEIEPEIELQERQPKRRKSVAGTILDSALEVALFTSAIGYAAFQLWRGNRMSESPSQSRLPLTPVLPTSPPPPYEQCTTIPSPNDLSSTLNHIPQRPRLTSKRSSQRKVTHIHVPRPRHPRSYHSTPIKSTEPIETITESFKQQLKLTEEEDLMGDFVPSINNYIPPTPLVEEAMDEEISEDVEVLAFKDKIQELIKSGHAALASKPNLSDEINFTHSSLDPSEEDFNQPTNQKKSCIKKSDEMLVLEDALDQTLKGTGRSWWET